MRILILSLLLSSAASAEVKPTYLACDNEAKGTVETVSVTLKGSKASIYLFDTTVQTTKAKILPLIKGEFLKMDNVSLNTNPNVVFRKDGSDYTGKPRLEIKLITAEETKVLSSCHIRQEVKARI